jgi:hypothetical protein
VPCVVLMHRMSDNNLDSWHKRLRKLIVEVRDWAVNVGVIFVHYSLDIVVWFVKLWPDYTPIRGVVCELKSNFYLGLPVREKEDLWSVILIRCTVPLLLFCTMTNKWTIHWQIITLLHVSTVLYHPQGNRS